jgi:putative transposase
MFFGIKIGLTFECFITFYMQNSMVKPPTMHSIKRWSSNQIGYSEFRVDETVNKISSEFIWLWIAIEPTNKEILGFSISKERNLLVAGRFLIQSFRRIWQTFSFNKCGTKYPQGCRFSKLDQHINSSYEKSLIGRAIQYIRDRTKCFDDYFSMHKKGM